LEQGTFLNQVDKRIWVEPGKNELKAKQISKFLKKHLMGFTKQPLFVRDIK